jgi:PadR family transcriptional regulator, regulatory protein PadR
VRVLAALLEDPSGWHHGYGLRKTTGPASGSLYPMLERLAERGLLETRWEEPTAPGRPPGHAYRLTGTGEALARECAPTQPAQPVRRRTHVLGDNRAESVDSRQLGPIVTADVFGRAILA